MSSFEEEYFKRQLNSALDRVRTVLDTARTPQFPSEVPHQYQDKYLLAEFLTNTSLAAQLNCLEHLGLTDKKLKEVLQFAQKRSVTLRFRAEEHCAFDREVKRKVTSPTEHVTEISGIIKATITDKVVTTVHDYFWHFDCSYELYLYEGNNPDKKVVLASRKGAMELLTSQKISPRSASVSTEYEANVTWLFQNIAPDTLQFRFAIDRQADTCHTPRRNGDIEQALHHFAQFKSFADKINSYFLNSLFPVHLNHGYDLRKVNDSGIFVPVLPLFDQSINKHPPPSQTKALAALKYEPLESVILPVADLNLFLTEQKRSIQEKFDELSKMFPDDGKVITRADTNITVIFQHSRQITSVYVESIDYIEALLYKQLRQAIGKEVTPVDFTNYMKHHNRQLFKDKYSPVPFCYNIRRPNHYPEGILSIEAQLDDGSLNEPLNTIVSTTIAQEPMNFSINAATKIHFYGERYLHAWVSHEFAGQSGLRLSLVARARQFSSFIMLVGTIASIDTFEPKCGIIIQNKDELKIPILLEQIPTPKEFRDAIESLSPEQQRFCKAYRSMQLASTLFGVVIIQIKPQLEKLLKLPEDSLTKEIQLSQDLMELFIKYQIPSDLLSYGGPPSSASRTKIEAVKKHVASLQEMIKISKDEQLKKQEQEHRYDTAKSVVEKEIRSISDELNLDYAEERVFKMKKKSVMKPEKKKRADKDTSLKKKGKVQRPVVPAGVSASVSAPSPSPTPQPADTTSTTDQISKLANSSSVATIETAGLIDYTQIPPLLDEKFEALDEDAALRPTIMKLSELWTKSHHTSLLSDATVQALGTIEQTEERNRTYDLLDALSRSGALSFDQASLHVVIGATHCFDRTITDTVIQKNINPIEKVERSLLILATTIHDTTAEELVRPEQLERVTTYSPTLFGLPSLKERRALEAEQLKLLKD